MEHHQKVLDADYVYDSRRGRFVNEKHERIARILKDYNPHLSLSYAPDKDEGPESAPFFVGFTDPGKGSHIIMWLRGSEINETLLAKIWSSDTTKNNPLSYLESLEAARQAVSMKEELERREEARERANFMIRTPYHTINLGKGKKVRT